MARRFDLSRRLEATRVANSPQVALEAVRAVIGDPLWFLGRQWRLGEHRGNDAAFPSMVHVTMSQQPITGVSDTPENNPRISPPETIIESEPEQWWTVGRRVRVGLALVPLVPASSQSDPALLIGGLAPPYDHLNATVLDGLALFRSRNDLGIDDARFADEGVPLVEPSDDWQPTSLHYDASFQAGPVTLDISGHQGGDVDWFSVSTDGQALAGNAEPVTLRTRPTRVTFPGSAAPRWWQISDRRFDPGAVTPQRTHIAQLLMIHAVSSHADDWFTAPLNTPTGMLNQVQSLEVIDSMGLPTTCNAIEGWSMFQVAGLEQEVFLVWPTVVGALSAPTSLDEVLVGIDEDANLLWAIERRSDGVELESGAPPTDVPSIEPAPRGQVSVTRARRYRYLPSTRLPLHWHPYVLTHLDDQGRVFVQARLANLNRRPIEAAAGPRSRLLHNPLAGPDDPEHIIDPSVVPRRGLRLNRRYRLGRRTDGLPVLWVQRHLTPLAAAPASSLGFDTLEELAQVLETDII
jgi:hypothetical protein